MLNQLIEQFCKEKRYLQGVSENTIYYYEVCFAAWKQVMSEALPDKININAF